MQCFTVVYNYPFVHWNHKNESNSKPLTFLVFIFLIKDGHPLLCPQMIYQRKWNFCNSINIFRRFFFWHKCTLNCRWGELGELEAESRFEITKCISCNNIKMNRQFNNAMLWILPWYVYTLQSIGTNMTSQNELEKKLRKKLLQMKI